MKMLLKLSVGGGWEEVATVQHEVPQIFTSLVVRSKGLHESQHLILGKLVNDWSDSLIEGLPNPEFVFQNSDLLCRVFS